MIPITWHRALRIAVDFEAVKRAEVGKVNLVVFGEPGNRQLKKSIAGSPWTSWYTGIDQDPSTVTMANVIPDPAFHDVFYILFEDEDAGEAVKSSCYGLEVVDYIAEVVTNWANAVQLPVQPVNPDDDKPYLGGTLSPEEYWYHVLETIYVQAFTKLLMTPLEGLDNNGLQDGHDADDILLLAAHLESKFDPKSASLFISKKTSSRLFF